jgi:hypothetical protein
MSNPPCSAGFSFVCEMPRNTYWLYKPTLPVKVQSGSGAGAAAGGGVWANALPASVAARAAAASDERRRSFWFMSESLGG